MKTSVLSRLSYNSMQNYVSARLCESNIQVTFRYSSAGPSRGGGDRRGRRFGARAPSGLFL